MDYEAFIKANLGKAVEAEDPSNYAQCFDWAFAYCDFLNIPRSAIRHLDAFQIWTQATDETRKYFDLIPNTPDAVPQKGDLVIFGTEVGPAGHVCIADGNGDTNTFQSTDQNWNGHLYVEFIWHTYGGAQGVLGFLRPKNQPEATVQVANSKFSELVAKSTKYDAFNAAGYATIDDVTKKVGGVQNDLQNAIKDKQNASDQAASLAAEIQKIHADDSQTASQLLDAQHTLQTSQDSLQALYKALNATDQQEALTSIQTLRSPHDQVVKQIVPVMNEMYNNLPKGKKLGFIARFFAGLGL